MQLSTSAASETNASLKKVFPALYNPPASMIGITGGLGADSPTVSAHSIHCETLRTLKLGKYVLRCEISGPSKLQHQQYLRMQITGTALQICQGISFHHCSQ